MLTSSTERTNWLARAARRGIISASLAASILTSTGVLAEELRWTSAGLTLFRTSDGKQGLERVEWTNGVDSHSVVVPANYDWIERPSDVNQSSFVVMRGMRYGLVDDKGRVLIEPQPRLSWIW